MGPPGRALIAHVCRHASRATGTREGAFRPEDCTPVLGSAAESCSAAALSAAWNATTSGSSAVLIQAPACSLDAGVVYYRYRYYRYRTAADAGDPVGFWDRDAGISCTVLCLAN